MVIRDGDWVLVDSDLKMGRYTWSMQNSDGSTTYRTDYTVDPTVEANTAMRNMADKGWKGDWHKVASIPMPVYYDKLHAAVTQDDMGYVNRFLNDSDNSAWRSKEGRV
jgi:hypothetical protein